MPIGFMNYRRGTAGYKKMATKVKRKIRAFVAVERPQAAAPLATRMRAIAKQTFNSQVEKKFCGLSVENGVVHNAQITAGDLLNIVPTMTQGQGYNQRSGDKIRPTSLTLDGAISYNDIGQSFFVPLSVVVFVLQSKRNRDPTLIANSPVNILLDNGQGAADWDGSTQHSMWSINRDEFEILGVKRIKLSAATAENAKCLSARYSMKVKTPTVLNYAQGGTLPTNYAPFLAIGWSRDDGQTPSSLQTYVVSTVNSKMYYTDA